MKAVSLFCGAGGLDLGAELAGYEIVIAVDIDPRAVETYNRNMAVPSAIRADVLELSPTELRKKACLGTASPDLLVAGPPCTPFSKSAFWLDYKRYGDDPKAHFLTLTERYIAAFMPGRFVIENVPALKSRRSPYYSAYRRFLDSLVRLKYDIAVYLIDATTVGVAQARKRLFIVGALDGLSSWIGYGSHMAGPLQIATAGSALAGVADVPEPEEHVSGKWAHLLPLVPPGGNYLYFTERNGHNPPLFEWRSRYWNFLLKLDPMLPSPTIQAHPGPATGPFHWENRRLRLSELKRLFGYPDQFVFSGSRNDGQRMIGNSVPPPMAHAVVLGELDRYPRLF